MRRILLLALLAGCFDPVEIDGALRCGAAPPTLGECPDGFTCHDDGLCWRGAGDAGAPDARLPPDAERPDAPPPAACNNGLDDDCDGKIDREDPGCANPEDTDEHGGKRCDNGLDDDFDGHIDFHPSTCGLEGDPGCDKPDDDSE